MSVVLAPADLDRRLYAYAVDATLVGGLAILAAVVTDQLVSAPSGAAAAVLLGTVLAGGLAIAVTTGLAGTSPGLALAALRVVREGSGTPIGVPAALGRQALLGAAALPTFGLGAAGLAWSAAADPHGRRRGWHDHLVGSVVVDSRPTPAADPAPASGPAHVVNLTALRLGPAPAAPAAPVEREPARASGPAAAYALPPRWRVGFDSGESFVVEGLVLVGRRPEPWAGQRARHLVPLPSADMTLSKTHAQLQVAADGALVVMDRGSTAGSVLLRGVPRALPGGRAVTLVDGDRVRFGDREMRVSRES